MTNKTNGQTVEAKPMGDSLFELLGRNLDPNRAKRDMEAIGFPITKSSGKVISDNDWKAIEELRSQFDPEPRDFQG